MELAATNGVCDDEMKLLIIRHGDPDYEHDSLTEKGWREAGYLAERLAKMDIAAFYTSPLGRAKDTAAPTLARMGRQAEERDWLREFHAPILRPDAGGRRIVPWDWLPQNWTREEDFFRPDRWHLPEVMQEGCVKEEYDRVAEGLDRLLADHGYVREGRCYRAERANSDTVALFCHFGVECILLSHLLNIPPLPLLHGFCAAPSSVTTVVTEERRQGIASFRVSAFGDISHLYVNGEEPSFSARFCECFDNADERHD